MIGEKYWATGITIQQLRGDPLHRWRVWVDFLDDGFCQYDSTEGVLRARYVKTDLDALVDVVKADAERLGIEFRRAAQTPTVYYEGDGEAEGDPPDARQIANQQAARLGWRQVYKPEKGD